MIAPLLLAAALAVPTPVNDEQGDVEPDQIVMAIAHLGAYRSLCRGRTPLNPVQLMLLRMLYTGLDPVAVAEGDQEALEVVRRVREADEVEDYCTRLEPVVQDINKGPFR